MEKTIELEQLIETLKRDNEYKIYSKTKVNDDFFIVIWKDKTGRLIETILQFINGNYKKWIYIYLTYNQVIGFQVAEKLLFEVEAINTKQSWQKKMREF